ncbi:hypothetical protein PCASD_04935 [Puccinia coronata f. sp. avenae]|uniref:Tet-like 2OG-Fe(II) oxygenase domain-containing protein n=1 Tax=Puccinia coronata f. sp. avenae TaxID=200324 RepID=A0A2N5VD10_9BASI|nr:hypothetical protein PCASD_04935 [Puccinia coronata f. sp. avenae]
MAQFPQQQFPELLETTAQTRRTDSSNLQVRRGTLVGLALVGRTCPTSGHVGQLVRSDDLSDMSARLVGTGRTSTSDIWSARAVRLAGPTTRWTAPLDRGSNLWSDMGDRQLGPTTCRAMSSDNLSDGPVRGQRLKIPSKNNQPAKKMPAKKNPPAKKCQNAPKINWEEPINKEEAKSEDLGVPDIGPLLADNPPSPIWESNKRKFDEGPGKQLQNNGNNPTKKKKNRLGKQERAAQQEAIAKAEADKIKEENQLKLDLEAYREKKPTRSIQRWLKNRWTPKTVNNNRTATSIFSFWRKNLTKLSSNQKARLKISQLTNMRGGRWTEKEDKTVVGYTPSAFLKCPSIKQHFSRFNNSFILTTGNSREVVAICHFSSFAEMNQTLFNQFNSVTTTLRMMEKVQHQVRRNGALVSGKMFSHGFRSSTTGRYRNTKFNWTHRQIEAKGTKHMKLVNQFIQQRAIAFAPGCIAANNKHAQELNLPSYSHDQPKRSAKPTEVRTVLGSNITWTHSNFSNKSHLDNDSSPFVYVLSAPTFSNTGRLARKQDGYNVAGGEFCFPSLKT